MNQLFVFFVLICNFTFANTNYPPKTDKNWITDIEVEISPPSEEGLKEASPSKITNQSIADLLSFVGLQLEAKDSQTALSENPAFKEQLEKLKERIADSLTPSEDPAHKEHFKNIVEEVAKALLKDPEFERLRNKVVEALALQASLKSKKHPERTIERMIDALEYPENLVEQVGEALLRNPEVKRYFEGIIEKTVEALSLSADPAHKEHLKESIKQRTPILVKQITKDYKLLLGMERTRTFIQERDILNVIRGYPLEALIFYTALGASMMEKAFTDFIFYGARTDPIWLENLIDQAGTPVGVFSLLCFMFFSGETRYFYTKALLDGFVFKKGPLKGYQIRPLMPTEVVKQSLNQSRDNWIAHGMGKRTLFPSHRLKYTGKRIGMQFIYKFGGSLGLSIGMTASNIVQELERIFGYNSDFAACRDAALSSQDTALACDIFWVENGGKEPGSLIFSREVQKWEVS